MKNKIIGRLILYVFLLPTISFSEEEKDCINLSFKSETIQTLFDLERQEGKRCYVFSFDVILDRTLEGIKDIEVTFILQHDKKLGIVPGLRNLEYKAKPIDVIELDGERKFRFHGFFLKSIIDFYEKDKDSHKVKCKMEMIFKEVIVEPEVKLPPGPKEERTKSVPTGKIEIVERRIKPSFLYPNLLEPIRHLHLNYRFPYFGHKDLKFN